MKPPCAIILVTMLGTAAGCASLLAAAGKEIYTRHCTECHGDQGQGVPDLAPDPLHGSRSLESLTRYIDRRMPEEEPELVSGEDAAAVAHYIYHAFYSPAARAGHPANERAFLRLTARQYRESIADLIGSFHPGAPSQPPPHQAPPGLSARYFSSEGMNKKAHHALDRADLHLDFDFAESAPHEGMDPLRFSIDWEGSLLPRRDGWHEFRITTPNGARLYLNSDRLEGDSNVRDDSGARRQPPIIDEWVSSGPEDRSSTARVFLLGGRPVPIRLDYFKYEEKRGALRLEWKEPLGEWQILAAPFLSTARSRQVATLSTSFPPEDSSDGYERGTSISKAWHEAATQAALETAGLISARLHLYAGTSDEAPDRLEKLRHFCAEFARRAFRRPPPDGWTETMIAACFTPDTAPEDAVKRAILRTLTSPFFLYPEWHPATDSLTVASRLALGLWDSLPDAELLAAAHNGDLLHENQIRHHAQRMLADPRSRTKANLFFRRWLMLDAEADLRKHPEIFPDFDAQLAHDLRDSLDRFIHHVLWREGGGDFREFLTSNDWHVSDRMAAYYASHPPDAAGGVLTHPYLLARLAHHDLTSPIHRGVFLTRNILGLTLRPPPEAIAFDAGRFDPAMSTREKVAEMTRDKSCMTCHETINPLGFSLEHYDASGRYRLEENQRPIDSKSEFPGHTGEMLQLTGPADVAREALASPTARRSFLRKLFQHLVQQAPETYGPDTLDALDAAFTSSGHQIPAALVEIHLRAARHGLTSPDATEPAKTTSTTP